MQLNLFDPPTPRTLDYIPTIKTPDDVYRGELRVVFHPDSGRSAVAVELTHDGSRELVSWIMLPLGAGEDECMERLAQGFAHLRARVLELWAPF